MTASQWVRLVPCILFTILMGCTTGGAKVESTVVEGGNLPLKDTFAWQGPHLVAQGVEATEEQVRQFDRSIEQGVTGALEDKGYRAAPAATADFLVTYQFVVRERSVERRRDPTPPSVSGSVGPGDPLDIVREAQAPETSVATTTGSVLVFATDRQSGRILWRGIADETVISVRRAVREIPRVIRKMMEGFPEKAR